MLNTNRQLFYVFFASARATRLYNTTRTRRIMWRTLSAVSSRTNYTVHDETSSNTRSSVKSRRLNGIVLTTILRRFCVTVFVFLGRTRWSVREWNTVRKSYVIETRACSSQEAVRRNPLWNFRYVSQYASSRNKTIAITVVGGPIHVPVYGYNRI